MRCTLSGLIQTDVHVSELHGILRSRLAHQEVCFGFARSMINADHDETVKDLFSKHDNTV